MPTPFVPIFGAAVVLNALVTYRSSDYYKQTNKDNANNAAAATTTTTLAPTPLISSGNSPSRDGVSAEQVTAANKLKWQALLKRYLIVYLLATLSDWMQGPYVYALYQDYGYSTHEIAVLFVAGFGSSMVFGSFIGGMADWGGRKAFVLLFCVFYAASCLTKHFRNFHILMLGRLLGGVSTSLLFSVFDAWLIRSHHDAGLKSYLGKSFSWAAYGNSIVAIVAGLLANKAASSTKMQPWHANVYVGGYLIPFDIALAALVTCGAMCVSCWDENYGDADASADASRNGNKQWHDGLRQAFVTTIRSSDILLCGIISSLFEGSMYVFVFMWSPSLMASGEQLPFGLIFSTFMVCCMAGSSLYSVLADSYRGEQLAVGVFAVGSFAMLMVWAATSSPVVQYLAMNIFEMTVGMYWPIMGTLKGAIVPESKRAAIYNLYRIPLNFIVLFSLLTDLSPPTSFLLNGLMLATATFLMLVLMKRRELNGRTESEVETEALMSDVESAKDADE